MSRPRAEMMPAVTVPPRPNGLPIATTQSPMREESESPKDTAVSVWPSPTDRTARSVLGSVPTTSASSSVSSWRVTVISSAPSMTWLLVTTMPASASRMKPEPRLRALRGGPSPPRSRNCSKNSSSGEPGGSWKPGPSGRSTSWVVEMLTTAGRSRSARSAKPSGVPRAWLAGASASISATASVVAIAARTRRRAASVRAPAWTRAVVRTAVACRRWG